MTGEYQGTPARLGPSRRSARNPKRLSSGLPRHLSRELFAQAEVVRLPAGRVLFWEGDSGDGCYRVEGGLLKLTMISKSGAERPELCQPLLRLLTNRMRERDKMLAATSFLRVKGRIAQILLELAEHFGQEVEPGRIVIRQRIGQYDLAAMVGTSREYVARTLSNWQRQKLVSRRRSGYYCLENKALLKLEVKYR